MGHHRPELEDKLTLALIVDIEARDVRRQQVRCELNPFEGRPDALCQGFRYECLADTGNVLEKHMTVGDECNHEKLDGGLLSDNDTGHITDDFVTEIVGHGRLSGAGGMGEAFRTLQA